MPKTTEQLFVPARLDSSLRNIHGFTDIESTGSLGYERGGGLSPESGILELVEEKDADGNITIRVVVPSTGPLNSAISVLFFYKSGSQAFATAREVPLFHDTSFSVTGVSRYVSAVYTDAFKLVPGTVYGIKWRVAGGVNDLVLSSAQHMRRLIDDEDLTIRAGELQKEIYETEDRVATLEAAGPGAPTPGGAPTLIGRGTITVDNRTPALICPPSLATTNCSFHGGEYGNPPALRLVQLLWRNVEGPVKLVAQSGRGQQHLFCVRSGRQHG